MTLRLLDAPRPRPPRRVPWWALDVGYFGLLALLLSVLRWWWR